MSEHHLVAIVPCSDLDKSEAFYARLGFVNEGDYPDYRLLADGKGGHLHLRRVDFTWPPGHNPLGLYFYTEDVDALAAEFRGQVIEPNGPEHKPWGMYEFALSDPDETLVRIGKPSEP